MKLQKCSLISIRQTFVFLLCFLMLATASEAQIKMHVIDVGQAEAILLEFSHQAILVDAGSETTDDDRYEARLLNYLNSFFENRPDLHRTFHSVIISHPHIDHTKNLVTVLTNFTVKNFIEGGDRTGSGIAQVKKARLIAAQKNITHYILHSDDIKTNDQMNSWQKELLDESEVNIRFLSGGRACHDENNSSLVMRIDYREKSILLTGDSEKDDLDKKHPGPGCGGLLYRLLNPETSFPKLLDVDVFMAPHHGSKNGTFELFLQKVTPQYTLISAGSPQTRSTKPKTEGFHAWFYGHPNEEAINDFEKYTSEKRSDKSVETLTGPKKLIHHSLKKAIYSTVWDGNIIVSISDAGVIQITHDVN